MAGIFDFLTQGTAPATAVTGGTAVSSLPPWYEEYMRNLLGRGEAAAAEPMPTYTLPRIAPLTEAQRGAITGAKTYAGTMAPLTQLGAETLTRGAAAVTPEQVRGLMSPYTEDITEIIGRRGRERYREMLGEALDPFTAGGQFGSERSMEFARRAAEQAERGIEEAQIQALHPAYTEALRTAQEEQARALKAGELTAGMGRGALDVLARAGAAEQEDIQKSLELAYKDYLEQREYPWTQLERQRALAQGVSLPRTETRTETAPVPGTAGLSPLELLLAVYGMSQT